MRDSFIDFLLSLSRERQRAANASVRVLPQHGVSNVTQTLKVGSQSIGIDNPDKLLYPAARFTKAAVVAYYIGVSRFILPHLKNRPVALKRYPEGIHGESFWEKDAPTFTPRWVRTVPVPRR